MPLNPFYWFRIFVGKLVMLTTGTWIGSHVDDILPNGLEHEGLNASDLQAGARQPEHDGYTGEPKPKN